MMPIQGIVFDTGGVLRYTPDLGVKARWEKHLGLKPGEMMERLSSAWKQGSVGTLSEKEINLRTADILGMSATRLQLFMGDIWTEYLGTFNIELAEYFRTLRPTYQTAILSNSTVGAREREQLRYRFDDICDFIIYSHEVGLLKPDPAIYALTCTRLGLQPDEVILLDDSESNIDAACKFGVHGIVFKQNKQAIADIQACIQANTLD